MVRELQTLRSQVGRDANQGYKHGTRIAGKSSEELRSGRGKLSSQEVVYCTGVRKGLWFLGGKYLGLFNNLLSASQPNVPVTCA